MKAMVLAAGFGTRLVPISHCRPKAAIPFLNRALVCHVLDWLAGAGVNQAVVNLHHLPERMREAVKGCGRGDLAIQFSFEPEILGTGGGIERARPWLEGNEPFVAVNAKIFTDIDLRPALELFGRTDALVVMIVVPNDGSRQFNPILLDSNGQVQAFSKERNDDGFIFTGIQIVSPRIFGHLPAGRFSDTVNDIYPVARKAGETIYASVHTGTWLEFSTLGRYLQWTRAAFDGKLAPLELPANVVGEDSEVETPSRVRRCVLGRGSRIGADCSLQDCILWDGVEVGPGSTLRGVIIADRVLIPPRTHWENVAVVRDPGPERRGAGVLCEGNLIVPIS